MGVPAGRGQSDWRAHMALRRKRRAELALAPKEAPLGACTRYSARCADARRYDHVLRPCCREHVRHIVETIAAAFAAAKVVWWADYGTLLGAVRNPLTTWADYPWLGQTPDGPIPAGIVPHDKDADIGLPWTQWARVQGIARRLQLEHGFDLTIRPHRGSMKVRLSRVNQTNLDMFFWHEKPNGKLYRQGYAQVDAFKGRDFHRDLLFPLTTVEWEGMTVPAPHDPEAFLKMRYGPGWRIPIPSNHDGVKR